MQKTINKELHEIIIMLGARPMSLPTCVIVRAPARRPSTARPPARKNLIACSLSVVAQALAITEF